MLPIILSSEPDEGRMPGGNAVAVQGYGLCFPSRVSFSRVSGKVRKDGATSNAVFAVSPKTASSLVIPVITHSAGQPGRN